LKCTLDRRCLRVAALIPALALGVAGCHHKNPPVSYQPPPPIAPAPSTSDVGSARPTRPTPGERVPANPSPGPQQPQPYGSPVSSEVGVASWYLPTHVNAKAADGSVYDPNAMTAANRELPMGSIVRVTNLANNQSVFVRITDRGPFVDGRIIDLSMAAAKAVDLYRRGTGRVRVEAYAPPAGSDPAGKWCVQIGAFLDQADAIQLKNDLMRRYTTAKVIEFAGDTGHWVRIYVKNPDKRSAIEIADRIHIPDPGVQPWLVRLN
jgi:rare lipoprotein A